MRPKESPSERLQRHITNNTLLRRDWGDGYERACLLVAIAPGCAKTRSAAACPASLLAPWFARMVPSMDDRGTAAAWPAMVQRFQLLVQKLEVTPLSAEAWEHARLRSLHASVTEARSHVSEDHTGVLKAIDDVLAWLDAGAPEKGREKVRAAAAAAAAA
nr:hypothetical protein [bacterium]